MEPILDTSASARLIVCERTGRWATALRRELAETGVRVWETRTLDECLRELAEAPASFVILELPKNVEGLLRFLSRLPRIHPAARSAVVAKRAQAEYETLVREAGAIHFLTSPRQAGLLAALAMRHLAQVPPPQLTMTERIWAGLPWGERKELHP